MKPLGGSWSHLEASWGALGGIFKHLAKLLEPAQCGGVHSAAALAGVKPHGAAPRRTVLAFDQLLMPVDEFPPALFTASPRADLAALAGHLPRLTALAWVPPLGLDVVRHVHDGFSDTEYSHYVRHAQGNSAREGPSPPLGAALALVTSLTSVPDDTNSSSSGSSSSSARSPSRAIRSERRAKIRARHAHAQVRSRYEENKNTA